MRGLAGAALLGLLVLAPSAAALSFLEDFESYTLVGLDVQTTPDQDWYIYEDTSEIAEVSFDGPPLSGSQWLYAQGTGDASANRVNFRLAAPTKLTNLSFEVAAVTVAEDGNGSQQYVAVESGAPRRSLVEFFILCTDASNATGCEFRVRWEHVDSMGQVLINATLGLNRFNVTILPDWDVGTFQLFVNGVDDGVFPFLELPTNIGRLRFGQASDVYAFNATLDNLFIDGAAEPVGDPEEDIVQFFRDFAADIHFTTNGSLFILGLWLFFVLNLAVAVPLMHLGKDNTLLPGMAFYTILTTLWLIYIEWWPDWIGISEIIVVAAIVGLQVRQRIMGLSAGDSNAALVAGSLGYFIIATSLLGFSGYATESVEVPTAVLAVDEDENVTADKQSFSGAVTECIVTAILPGNADCSRDTQSDTWGKITDFASTVFNFGRSAFKFLFQLLTFSLPIPAIFNVIIILPPASAMATVGFSFITRSG